MKLWLWPRDRRPRCPVVEVGDPCPWLASVDVHFGAASVVPSPAVVRLCHWHAGYLAREIARPARPDPLEAR